MQEQFLDFDRTYFGYPRTCQVTLDMDSNSKAPISRTLPDCSVVVVEPDPELTASEPLIKCPGSSEAIEDYRMLDEQRLEEEALEIARSWNKCTKNSGHLNFIPVDDFSLKSLPQDCRREEVVTLVKSASQLTVKLTVRKLDIKSPEKDKDILPSRQEVGTGFMVGITRATDPCFCAVCKNKERVKRWWCLDILTASHVVSTTAEAQHTQVYMFYNSDKSRTDKSMKSCQGLEVIDKYDNGDWSYVQCALHDKDVAKKLMQSIRHFKEAEDIVDKIPKNQNFFNTVIAISHPHGQPKMVTIGKLHGVDCLESGLAFCPVLYTTPRQVRYSADTCPGSSGAPILWLGMDADMAIQDAASKKMWMKLAIFYRILGLFFNLISIFCSFYALRCSFDDCYLAELPLGMVTYSFFQVLIACFLWNQMLWSLRGRHLCGHFFDALKNLHLVQFQSQLFKSRVKLCLYAIDFGSTTVMNLLQIFFIFHRFLDLRHLDTKWASLSIIIICYSATPTLIVQLYVVHRHLEHHLNRAMVMKPRVLWVIACVFVSLSACRLNDSIFSLHLFLFISYISTSGYLVHISGLLRSQDCCPVRCVKWFRKHVSRLRSLHFIHSRREKDKEDDNDDDNDEVKKCNISKICYVR